MLGKFFLGILGLLVASQSFSYTQTGVKESLTKHEHFEEETCFSPEEECAEKLVQFLSSAKKSLDVAIYSINLEGVVDTLISMSRKIPVRVVCDKVQAHGAKSKVLYLLENGVSIRYGKQKGIMHHKFAIVDNELLETGSFNYTNRASTSNQENQIYLSKGSTVQRFVDRFEAIWDSSVEIDMNSLQYFLRSGLPFTEKTTGNL